MPVIIIASAPLLCRKGQSLALPQRRHGIIYYQDEFASNIQSCEQVQHVVALATHTRL